jgi:PAS domain S-box-containing protein
MDCEMPELNGYDATREIRSLEDKGHRTPVIAMTAHTSRQSLELCLDAGMDDHIAKPLRSETLKAVLDARSQGPSRAGRRGLTPRRRPDRSLHPQVIGRDADAPLNGNGPSLLPALASVRRLRTVAPGRWLAVASVLVVSLLAALVWTTERQAEDAVRGQARNVAVVSARVSAQAIGQEVNGLRELVQAYAQRPFVVDALARGSFGDSRARNAVRQLESARPGIAVAFATRLDGRLVEISPATPSAVGVDFSYRDWYQGVRRSGTTYLSEAYSSVATPGGAVVAAAATVRRRGRPVGILVAAYDVMALQEYAMRSAAAQDVRLTVVDQRGITVAGAPTGSPRFVSRRGDPPVREALRGRSGVMERRLDGRAILSAFSPVPNSGWGVVADLDEADALTGVAELRRTQWLLGVPLFIGMLVGVALFIAERRRRARVQDELRRAGSHARSIVQTAPEAFVALGSNDTIRDFNPAAERLFGWPSDEVLGRPLDETIALTLREDGRSTLLTGSALGALSPGARVFARGPQGRTVSVELAVASVGDESGNLNVFIRDVSARDRADTRAGALAGVATALAECDRLEDAMTQILSGLGEPLGWSFGAFWTLDREQQTMSCTALWHREGLDAAAFAAATKDRRLARGTGFPGRTWELNEILWVPDVVDFEHFTRHKAARVAGLHAGVGIPFMTATESAGCSSSSTAAWRHPTPTCWPSWRPPPTRSATSPRASTPKPRCGSASRVCAPSSTTRRPSSRSRTPTAVSWWSTGPSRRWWASPLRTSSGRPWNRCFPPSSRLLCAGATRSSRARAGHLKWRSSCSCRTASSTCCSRSSSRSSTRRASRRACAPCPPTSRSASAPKERCRQRTSTPWRHRD